jgi:hypothetical protein
MTIIIQREERIINSDSPGRQDPPGHHMQPPLEITAIEVKLFGLALGPLRADEFAQQIRSFNAEQ